MTAFLQRELATDRVIQQVGVFDPEFVGPPGPPPFSEDGFEWLPMTAAIEWAGRPPSHVLKWNGGAQEWVDGETLGEKRGRAILEVDAFADAARLAVVGDAARIKEYERAQLGAEQYRDAGYTGVVPPAVASWAHAKRREGWTAQQAAEDILAASARWYSALEGIRALRLDAKETIRAATTGEEVAATAATFRTTLTAAMQGVQ